VWPLPSIVGRSVDGNKAALEGRKSAYACAGICERAARSFCRLLSFLSLSLSLSLRRARANVRAHVHTLVRPSVRATLFPSCTPSRKYASWLSNRKLHEPPRYAAPRGYWKIEISAFRSLAGVNDRPAPVHGTGYSVNKCPLSLIPSIRGRGGGWKRENRDFTRVIPGCWRSSRASAAIRRE